MKAPAYTFFLSHITCIA